MDQQEHLDTTIEALSGDLTKIKPADALEVISTWRRALGQSSDAALTEVSETLGELRNALDNKSLDGKKIGGILSRLGEQTSACAKAADAAYSAKLTQLGNALSKVGKTLG